MDVTPNQSAEQTVRVRYFAQLREERGRSEETVTTNAETAGELFDQIKRRFDFSFSREELRVAVNASFCDWEVCVQEDDLVVFIPPVAGG